MIKGEVKLTAHFDRISKQHHAGFAKVVEHTARTVEGWSKVFAPIDTGYLRNSIQALGTYDPLTWLVNVGAEYGLYQEFGTIYQAGTPFLRPAMHGEEVNFVNGLHRVMNEDRK